MKKLVFGFLIFGLIAGSLAGHALAEEEETDYSFGILKSATASEMVVTEYDYEQDKDVDVTYSVDANVKLDNTASVAAIPANSNVEIDFVTRNDKKVAVAIAVEKPLEEVLPEDAATEGN